MVDLYGSSLRNMFDFYCMDSGLLIYMADACLELEVGEIADHGEPVRDPGFLWLIDVKRAAFTF